MDVEELAKARLGHTLRGKWRLDALLGCGAMAAVYAARHRNGKRAAVKVLHAEFADDADLRQRFVREGYLANAVGHPGAVAVLDDDVDDDGAAYLVMELLEGESLEHRAARKGGALDPREILAVVDKLLDVLAAAHAKGIVHRDVKPDNVFLARDGTVKLLDFGIARLAEHAAGETESTRMGVVVGTPTFMPPEQASGRWDEVDGRADLWAVGALMYTCGSGRHVHEGRDLREQLLAAATRPAAPLRQVMPTAPIAFARVVDRALAFARDARWADAATMQEAVREAYWAPDVDGAPASSGGRAPVDHAVSIRQQAPAVVAAVRAAVQAEALDATERLSHEDVARLLDAPASRRETLEDDVVVFHRGADGRFAREEPAAGRRAAAARRRAAPVDRRGATAIALGVIALALAAALWMARGR